MRKRSVYLAIITVLLVPPWALAVEVLSVEVKVNGDMYHMRGESIIEAPADFVFDVLMDFDNFHRLAGGIAESRFLDPSDEGILLGYTRIDSCVLFFCRQLEKVEKIHATAPSEIITEVIPEQSDFKFNKTHWSLKTVDGGTLVIYEADMDPAFWVPPLIGPWALKRKLERSAEQIGWRIEYLAVTGQPLSNFGN